MGRGRKVKPPYFPVASQVSRGEVEGGWCDALVGSMAMSTLTSSGREQEQPCTAKPMV